MASHSQPLADVADPRAYLPRVASEEVLAALTRWLERGGRTAVLGGAPGVGTTLVLRVFEARERVRRRVLFSPFLHMEPESLESWLAWLALGSSAALPGDWLAALRSESGASPLLLIDDAHAAALPTLMALGRLRETRAPDLRICLGGCQGAALRRASEAVAGDFLTLSLAAWSAADLRGLAETDCAHPALDAEQRQRLAGADLDALAAAAEGSPRLLRNALSERCAHAAPVGAAPVVRTPLPEPVPLAQAAAPPPAHVLEPAEVPPVAPAASVDGGPVGAAPVEPLPEPTPIVHEAPPLEPAELAPVVFAVAPVVDAAPALPTPAEVSAAEAAPVDIAPVVATPLVERVPIVQPTLEPAELAPVAPVVDTAPVPPTLPEVSPAEPAPVVPPPLSEPAPIVHATPPPAYVPEPAELTPVARAAAPVVDAAPATPTPPELSAVEPAPVSAAPVVRTPLPEPTPIVPAALPPAHRLGPAVATAAVPPAAPAHTRRPTPAPRAPPLGRRLRTLVAYSGALVLGFGIGLLSGWERGEPTRLPPQAPPSEASAPAVSAPPPAAVPPPAPEPRREDVQVNAQPWASIRLDGRPLGVTPLLERGVATGEHEFEATFPDGRRERQVIRIGPDSRFVSFR